MELMETLRSGASFDCMIQQTKSDDLASVIGYVNQIKQSSFSHFVQHIWDDRGLFRGRRSLP
jgi:hypothetical protein